MRHFRASRRRRCVCDPDGTMPGHCPGPDNCPYAGDEDEDAIEARERREEWEADACDRARDGKMDSPA